MQSRENMDENFSSSAKQELQVFRRKLLHRDGIVVDGTTNHAGLLLLKQNHT